ncbi:MAG: lipid-binding SYLF domain-containing protein [Terriglobales bacterium]
MRRFWPLVLFFAVLPALVLVLVAPMLSATSNRDDDIARLEAATRVFRHTTIPQGILQGAKCIAIIPGEKHFALGIGGQYGKGLVICRNNDHWSAPAFITLAGASYGFQIGGESSDLVLIFQSKHGAESLLSNKIKIGASASAAAGPIGRKASASTNASVNAEILTYSRSHGAFVGVDLNGSVVQPDDTGNIAMYGMSPRYQQILNGTVPPPPQALPLLREIARVTAAVPPPAPRRPAATPPASH